VLYNPQEKKCKAVVVPGQSSILGPPSNYFFKERKICTVLFIYIKKNEKSRKRLKT
jgi:hypothetical protein